MNPGAPERYGPRATRGRRRAPWVAGIASGLTMLCLALGGAWVGGAALAADGKPASTAAAHEEGPAWSELKPAQQATLAPLQAEWRNLNVANKRKWVELATRFPKLAPAEQARVQARMGEWARMTPAERGAARLHYQAARQLPSDDKKARWDAYQALPPEQKRQLAARSASQAGGPIDPAHRTPGMRGDRPAREPGPAAAASAGRGSAIAPAPAPRAIAPALVQAAPGATTTLIDRRPTPPEHLRPGARDGVAPPRPTASSPPPR